MNPGTRVAFFRHEMGLTQQELAEKVSISRPMLTQIERGTKAMSLQLAADIAKVLQVEIVDLLD